MLFVSVVNVLKKEELAVVSVEGFPEALVPCVLAFSLLAEEDSVEEEFSGLLVSSLAELAVETVVVVEPWLLWLLLSLLVVVEIVELSN